MDFFDDLGKKLTATGQCVVQKSKEKIDIANLMTKVELEKRNLSGLYAELGRKYADLHHDDYEEEFEDIFTRIREYEKKIEDYMQQMNDIKGIQKCPCCGAGIPVNSVFCCSCGKPVAEDSFEE